KCGRVRIDNWPGSKLANLMINGSTTEFSRRTCQATIRAAARYHFFVLMLREKPLQCIPRCAPAASQSPRRLSAIEDLPVQGVRKLVALGNGPVPGSRPASGYRIGTATW